MPFVLPAAIALPIVTGFLLAGPILGFLVAVVVAAAIAVVAIRMKPRESSTRAGRAEPSTADGRAGSPEASDGLLRRAAARRFTVPLVIAAVGIVLIAAADGTARIIGWGVLAVAISVTISLVFLEIGYSEDRARARDARDRSLPRRDRRGGRPPASRRRSRDTQRGIRG
jgi:hypothetical protein